MKPGVPIGAAEARAQALGLRKKLSSGQVASLSRNVIGRFLESSGLLNSALTGLGFALYQALPGELDLSLLEEKLQAAGVRLFFPRIVEPFEGIEFVEMGAQNARWEEGPYGIRQPHHELPAVSSAEIGMIFVPGSAFGLQGERVGMGKGYYDRFLARVTKPLRVALAYDFQLFERIQTQPWDQPVDWIVTETREVRISR